MLFTRRQIIQGIGGIACFPFVSAFAEMNNVKTDRMYISGAGFPVTSGKDEFFVSAFDGDGNEKFKHKLPARGHGLAVSPDAKKCAIFARRPGNFIYLLNSQKGLIEAVIKSKKNRVLYGHGEFSPSGNYLLSTEKDMETGLGVVSIRDLKDNYKVINQYDNFGIGPHEMAFMPDGKTIVIAVGGIQTKGRKKTNLDTMESSLVYIDIQSGKIIDKFTLEKKYFQLSIRHLSVSKKGQVGAVMQYQNNDKYMPLVLTHDGESVLKPLSTTDDICKKMNNYCGSVCYDNTGTYLATSSPRSSTITIWSSSGEYITSFDVADGCGVSATEKDYTFLISSGIGGVFTYDVKNKTIEELDSLFTIAQHWDNHLLGF
ncbi:MAG: DUF1513 domain-containing protein [Alphaproteobacteria bacterium]